MAVNRKSLVEIFSVVKKYRRPLLQGDSPAFVSLFDEAIAAVSESGNLDQYLAIRRELAGSDSR